MSFAMIRKCVTLLPISLLITFICEAEGSYSNYDLNSAMEYLQGYNGIPVPNVVVLASPSLFETSFVEDIYSSAMNQQNPKFTTAMVVAGNLSQIINKIRRAPFPSVIVLPDFEFSKNVQNAFFHFPFNLKKKNSWLILLSSDYNTHDEMYKHLIRMISRHPHYLDSFKLNSQIYAVVKIKGVAQIVEMYQICDNRPISLRQLSFFPNNGSNLKNVWEHRKDLDQCTIKVGYMNYG